MPVDESTIYFDAMFAPKRKRITAASRLGVAHRAKTEAGGEDGYFNGTTGLPVGLHTGFLSWNIWKRGVPVKT